MFKDITIPDSIGLREDFKRKYTFMEMYNAFSLIPGAAAKLIRNRNKRLLSDHFIERIQLAVTEVLALIHGLFKNNFYFNFT